MERFPVCILSLTYAYQTCLLAHLTTMPAPIQNVELCGRVGGEVVLQQYSVVTCSTAAVGAFVCFELTTPVTELAAQCKRILRWQRIPRIMPAAILSAGHQYFPSIHTGFVNNLFSVPMYAISSLRMREKTEELDDAAIAVVSPQPAYIERPGNLPTTRTV